MHVKKNLPHCNQRSDVLGIFVLNFKLTYNWIHSGTVHILLIQVIAQHRYKGLFYSLLLGYGVDISGNASLTKILVFSWAI